MKALALLLLLAIPAHAGFISCQSDPHDTGLILSWDDQVVALRVVSPMGYEFMPQLEGPVSASMGPFLKMQAADLKPLGDDFTLHWKRSACALDEKDPWVLSCGPGSDFGSIKIVGLSGAALTERRAGGNQVRWNLRLTLAPGNTYFVGLQAPKEACRPQ